MKKLIFYYSFLALSAISQAQPTPDPDRWELFTESYDGTTNVFIDKQTIGRDSAWFLLTNAVDTAGSKTNMVGHVFFRCGQHKIAFGRQSVIDITTGRVIKVESGDPSYFVDVFPSSVQENIYIYFCNNYYQ
ncbi:hypothetical protein H9Q10_05870 [Eikenella sp. S3360]|uniref:Uncharacterized protein n=1 Tax=Eikenella glucosivorans TaxID=2766967 RepID=A0ABS0NA67_9NEIS|nr:hypothetical protein [Eikenella glucosivorans]MBH5329194.1 hypothetical protein [Eikenella glucosivorans]